jgi:hypothetical protein
MREIRLNQTNWDEFGMDLSAGENHGKGHSLWRLTMFVALVVAMVSCERLYSHEVINETRTKVFDVTIFCGTDYFMHGVLIPDASKGYSGSFRIPGNSEATVSWKNEKGESVSSKVDIPAHSSSKRVVLIIRDDGVSVTFRDI